MKIAITDANIFIDLIHIGLQDNLFELDLEVHTTIEVCDELNQTQNDALNQFIASGKLTCHVLNDPEIEEFVKNKRGLSESDKLLLHLAIQLEATILTGDSLIRKISEASKIEVHGIFWLLDKFVEGKHITRKQACHCITDLMGYNKRLPQSECDKRLGEWIKK